MSRRHHQNQEEESLRSIRGRGSLYSSEPEYASGSSDSHDTLAQQNSRRRSAQSYGDPRGSSTQDSARRHYYDMDSQWHAIPRAWGTSNPETYRVVNDPTLNRFTFAPLDPNPRNSHGSSNRSHQSPTQQSHATPARGRTSDSAGPPFTLARLDQYNDTHAPTTNMHMWRRQGQRDGAWDGVGYVKDEDDRGRRSNGY